MRQDSGREACGSTPTATETILCGAYSGHRTSQMIWSAGLTRKGVSPILTLSWRRWFSTRRAFPLCARSLPGGLQPPAPTTPPPSAGPSGRHRLSTPWWRICYASAPSTTGMRPCPRLCSTSRAPSTPWPMTRPAVLTSPPTPFSLSLPPLTRPNSCPVPGTHATRLPSWFPP